MMQHPCRAQPPGRTSPRGPSGRGRVTLPEVSSYEKALRADDAQVRFMAHALEWLTSMVPGTALFWTVDWRLRPTRAPHVLKISRPLRIPLADAQRAYEDRFRLLDPFDPQRFAETNVTVANIAYVGGQTAFERTAYGGVFLPCIGLKWAACLYLRDAGRIVAGVKLLREPELADFTAGETALLQHTHRFLQSTFVLARRVPLPSSTPDVLSRYDLTPREREVARLAAGLATNTQIGHALFISPATVKTHITHVFAKLGIQSRTQLLLLVRSGDHAPGAIELGSAEN
jgi:DNA-binding CsgD family transcriptional regulator